MLGLTLYYTAEQIDNYIRSVFPDEELREFEDCTFAIYQTYIDTDEGIEVRVVPVKKHAERNYRLLPASQ